MVFNMLTNMLDNIIKHINEPFTRHIKSANVFAHIVDIANIDHQTQQVAQLSQRDRAAGWVSFGQKCKMIFCRQCRSIFNHCDVIGIQTIELGEIKQNKGYNAVQGHSRSRMSVPIERSYATFY